MKVPITLLVDDPAPLVNIYWWHARRDDLPRHSDGRPVVRDVPLDFLRRFAELVGRWEMKGKFSVIPYPAGLGPITEGWPGCDMRALRDWIDIVRRDITPYMDISPEILTHAQALDLEAMELLPENENEWSKHQTADTLTPYIAYALKLLDEVGLEATGVTSPWSFGSEVEEEYRRAIVEAMLRVHGRKGSWYFLHTHTEGTEFRSQVVLREGDRYLVSIWAQVAEYLWHVMETGEGGPEVVRRVADRFVTEDGEGGRLAELFKAGTPMVLLTHWQSLFCDGRETGLKVLDEVCRRVKVNWGDKVRWVKCSELAEEVAGGIYG